MAQFLLGRLVQGLLALIAVTMIVFALVRLAGDPAVILLPPDASSDPRYIEEFRESLGLNDPLPVQYGKFVVGVLHGDFGVSIRRGRPAMQLVAERVGATVQLAVAALLIALAMGSVLGSVAALHRGSWIDQLSTTLVVLAQSFPNFWLGLMLILLFAVKLQWLPPSGRLSTESLVLPALTLAAYPLAQIGLLVRAGLVEVMEREYILVARSKGLAERVIVTRHALKNVAIPVITLMGLQARNLLAGSIIVETVFAWPGIGLLTIQAVEARDFPVLQASVFLFAVVVVMITLGVDMLYSYVDPRVRLT